jgi:hypothetical protein
MYCVGTGADIVRVWFSGRWRYELKLAAQLPRLLCAFPLRVGQSDFKGKLWAARLGAAGRARAAACLPAAGDLAMGNKNVARRGVKAIAFWAAPRTIHSCALASAAAQAGLSRAFLRCLGIPKPNTLGCSANAVSSQRDRRRWAASLLRLRETYSASGERGFGVTRSALCGDVGIATFPRHVADSVPIVSNGSCVSCEGHTEPRSSGVVKVAAVFVRAHQLTEHGGWRQRNSFAALRAPLQSRRCLQLLAKGRRRRCSKRPGQRCDGRRFGLLLCKELSSLNLLEVELRL